MYNYVIFHRNCNDGFTSFIILNKSNTIDKNALIFADVPSARKAPHNIYDKDIIIMDVAYTYDVLKDIFEQARSVIFIDHHVTIHDDVLKLKDEFTDKNIKIIYDEHECGSTLTWKYLFGDKPIPLFVKHIRDNDIGLWKMENTDAIIANISTNYDIKNINKTNVDKWNKLFDETKLLKLIKKGNIYMEYINNLLSDYSKRYSLESFPSNQLYEDYSEYFKKPGKYKVAVVCGSGCPNASMLGRYMMKNIDCDFVIMWTLNLNSKQYVLTFRSLKINVGRIAKMFGGGGHKLAASCIINMQKYNITDLFFPVSLPRY
jgi:oligoribonuclease NrnB/cAMP/cGMP phosphodiesterase (DHH superfamily)